jgi:CRISPR-associated protein Cas2
MAWCDGILHGTMTTPSEVKLVAEVSDVCRLHVNGQLNTANGKRITSTMRKVFIICYDVCDAKRLRKVYKTLKGAGDALQYSVFRCELTPEEKQDLLSQLWEIINPGQDRLLFANLGPVESRGVDCLEYWGEPREQPEFTRPIVL